jgi:hypothetical protein
VNSILSSVLARFMAFTDQIFENDNNPSFEAKVPFGHHHQQSRIDSIMTVVSEDTSVGTMGIQSQRRSPGKKKMKSRRGKMNSYFQPNEAALTQEPSIMNGSKVCKGCVYHSSVYKNGHDLTCPKSDYFGMTQKRRRTR